MKKTTLQKSTWRSSYLRMICLAVLCLAGSHYLQAQIQLGQSLLGNATSDQFGKATVISGDASTIAVGVPSADGGGSNIGEARAYRLVAGVWTQIGQTITGSDNEGSLGWQVALNNDGTILAVSAPFSDTYGTNRGYVQVFELSGGVWTQLGSDIVGEADNDVFGFGLDINGAGNRIVIGGAQNDANGSNAGHVRVFDYSGGVWTQIGADIDGEAADDNLGYSVAITDIGNRIVVGAPFNSGAGAPGSVRGHARVYDFVASNWVQYGSDIDGEANNDRLGHAVDIDALGNTIVVGSYYAFEGPFDRSGNAKVFDISGTITQIGAKIIGNFTDDFCGSSVSISGDGTRVAIGENGDDASFEDAGQVRIFDNIGSVWTQVGLSLFGEGIDDSFGISVGLSDDGDYLIGGAEFHNNTGQARVYALDLVPTAICQNITVFLNGSGQATITAADVDNGSFDTQGPVTLSIDQSSFDCSNVGTPVSVTLTVADTAMQTATCTATVTVEDTITPSITCPANVTRYANGNCEFLNLATDLNAVFTDNCSGATLENDYNFDVNLIFEVFPLGVTNVAWTVTDVGGNSNTCSMTITVVDTLAPVISCVADTVLNTGAGVCDYLVQGTEFDATFTDNCSGGSITNNFNNTATLAGEVLPTGVTSVVWTATDASGNTSTCTTAITVADTTTPVMTCAANTTRYVAAGSCTYTVQGTEFDPSVIENCTINFVINSFNGSSTLAGAVLPIGNTWVVWGVQDNAGNTTSCATTITVVDTLDPVITCVANATRNTVPGSCVYFAQGTEFDATFTDNCSGGSITNDINGLSTLDGENFNTGSSVVTWTATDASGNTSTCTTTITVVDNEAPTITCQDYTLALASDGLGNVSEINVLDDYSDNCTNNGALLYSFVPQTFDCSNLGANTVTVTVTDASGNASMCTSTVTVVDTTAPVITCPADQSVLVSTSNTYTLPDYVANGSVSATDNCSSGSGLTYTQSPADGTTLGVGTHTISVTSEDESGNTDTCSFELLVESDMNVIEITELQGLEVFPNPTSTNLTIANTNDLTLIEAKLYDLSGRLVKTIDLRNTEKQTVIDVSNLERAAYVLVVKGELGVSQFSVLVQY